MLKSLRNQPTSNSRASIPKSRDWIIATAIVVLIFIGHWPALHAGFIWDDDSMLTDNRLIKLSNGLYYIWFTTAPTDYFPLTYSSLWLEWRLWGANPLGYHAVNILLHAGSCLVLWKILQQLKVPGAWLAAMLFAIHPVNVESVAWIAERKNVLAMFFFLLSVWTYVLFQRKKVRWFYLISLGTFVLSLLAKTSAVGWPLVIVAIIWWKRESLPRAIWAIPFFAVSIALGLVTIWFQNNRAIGNDFIQDHDFATRISAAGSAVWFYFYKAVLPLNLCFVYPKWNINTHQITAYLPLSILGGLLGLFWVFRERWGRTPLFALLYYILLLAPVLGFFDIYFHRYSFVADHWQYFALPIVAAVVAAGLTRLRVQTVLGPALVLLFLTLTFTQAKTYQSSQTLWTSTLSKNPRCWLAHNNLGMIVQEQGATDRAIEFYKQSLACNPNQVEAHNNWGSALFDAGIIDDAMQHFQAAYLINSNSPVTLYNVANIHDRQGQIEKAVLELREAIRLKNDYPQALNNLGCILALQGKTVDAIACLQRAVYFSPDYADALSNLGSILNDNKKPKEALPLLTKAVQIEPASSDAHLNLGNTLLSLGQTADALSHFRKAVELKPTQYLARYGEASALLKSGKPDEAEKGFSDVLKQHPGHAESYYQLAMILQMHHDRKEAVERLKEAVQLRPDWIEALNNLAWAIATDEHCKPAEAQKAVRFAQHAVDLTHGADASAFDTLGAAWARNEVFSKALESAETALLLATNSRDTNLLNQIESRIKLYKNRIAYAEP